MAVFKRAAERAAENIMDAAVLCNGARKLKAAADKLMEEAEAAQATKQAYEAAADKAAVALSNHFEKEIARLHDQIAALVQKVSAMELAAEEATQQKTYVEKRLAVANATIALRSIESNGVEDSIRWAAGARLAGAHNDLRKHVTEAHNQSCRAAARSSSAPPTMRT